MKEGQVYRIVAPLALSIYEGDEFSEKNVRARSIGTMKSGDTFFLLKICMANEHDHFVRCLIMFEGQMVSIKVGENIPKIAFEHVKQAVSSMAIMHA